MMETKVNNARVLSQDERLIKDLKNHLTKSEGSKSKIYLDFKGVPTIGVGIALGEVDKAGQVKVHPFDQINSTLTQAGPGFKIAAKNHKLLEQAVAAVNEVKAERKKETDPKKQEELLEKKNILIGEQNRSLEKEIYLSLEEPQISKLFNAEVKTRLVEIENISTHLEIPLQRDPMETPMEAPNPKALNYEGKLLLIDLYFRGQKNLVLSLEQNITKALQRGDNGALAVEVLYRSNAEKERGNDKRNFISLERYVKSLEPKERKEVLKSLEAYRKANPEAAQEVHARIESLNKQRKKRREAPLDFYFTEVQKELEALEEKEAPEPQAEGGAAANSDGNSSSSSTVSTSGEVGVRAHTREGYDVRAYTRSKPN